MDPLTLIIANAGLSVFNNWRNNRQNSKLQEKQQEFARASAERNRKRMRQLMHEGQELALEMERESHENRLEDIRNDFDRILHRMAYSEAIKTWPLKVLPIVMKRQCIGNLLSSDNENIAMHCIFTPSNCSNFNRHIFPLLENNLTEFFNQHWNTLSSHPVLFYSGAWKTGTVPTGVEIDLLKTNLRNLPTLIITPFFKPEGGLVFQINSWGIGMEIHTEIESFDFSYAAQYKSGIDYIKEDGIKETTIEELVPYLQCIIGYIADQYFWTSHNEAPLLPTLLTIKAINTDGMPYLTATSRERYSNLLELSEKEAEEMPFSPEKMLFLFEGSAALWNTTVNKDKFNSFFIRNCKNRSGVESNDITSAIKSVNWTLADLTFLTKVLEVSSSVGEETLFSPLKDVLNILQSIDIDFSILESKNIAYLESLTNDNNPIAQYRLGEIYEYSMGTAEDLKKAIYYYSCSAKNNFILANIKTGKIIYSDVNQMIINSLRLKHIIQIDILYSDSLIKQAITNQSDINTAIEVLSDTFMAIKNKYSHPGLIYNLAILKIKKKEDIAVANQLLHLAAKLGYNKAKSYTQTF